jgi:LuxR family maltose regulon positive regulatory protein
MRLLLSQWLTGAAAGSLRDYAARLLSAFDAEQPGVTSPESVVSPDGGLVEPLTRRELEILQLICAGHSNRTIADKLVITISTAKKHTGNILAKLGVTSRAQAMVKARQLGLTPKDN